MTTILLPRLRMSLLPSTPSSSRKKTCLTMWSSPDGSGASFLPCFKNLLTFVLPKYSGNLGQICVDSTNALNSSNDGAPNRQIPKPSTPHHLNENPPISYSSALWQCLTWIYNVRLDHPSEDILMLPDNISTAFHQLFYHPSMMPIFHPSLSISSVSLRA